MIAAGLLALLLVLLLPRAALGSPGNEIVVVLDNSGSMAAPYHETPNKVLPASDPGRVAVLGALAMMGVSLGSTDRVTVISFADKSGEPPRVIDPTRLPQGMSAEDAIRATEYVNQTLFKKALEEARKILTGSDRDGKLLLLLTDGAPTDITDTSEAPKLLGLPDAPFGTLILGLFGSEDAKSHGVAFLRPLAKTPEDLVLLNGPAELISAFTGAYARVLGSKPLTGKLSVGGKVDFDVGKHVVEVLAITASSQPGPAFTASLTGPKGASPVLAQGHNGCKFKYSNAPGLCEDPRRHYQVFRQPNDPEKASRWTLSLPKAQGDVEYGVILRYDILATLAAGPVVKAGEAATIEARLLFRGNAFVDEAFFKADGFEAVATVQGEKIPLKHVGDGRFVGTWTPARGLSGTSVHVRATFRNTWLERSAERPVLVEGPKELVLRVAPDPIDLGAWKGGILPTRRCATIDLTGSTNADIVDVVCGPAREEQEMKLTCTPVAGSEAAAVGGAGKPMRWEVCATATRCCGDRSSTASAPSSQILLTGKDPRFGSSGKTVSVLYQVQATGFLPCWWPVLAALAALLVVIFVVVGIVRPHSFDPAAAIRVAGSEAGLRRTSGLILRELPGGVKGFYRNARIALNGTGDFVRKAKQAVFVIEADRAGTTVIRSGAGLERKVQRTGKWEPVAAEEMAQGFVPGLVYRVGNLYVKFE